MGDGRVRLRSNVIPADVRDSRGWRLVPGELVAIHHKELLQSPNRPPRLQHDERMYYEPCGWCGRNASQIALEGCDECSSGPTPDQLRLNRERHEGAIVALQAARVELTAQAATAEAASRASRVRSAVVPKSVDSTVEATQPAPTRTPRQAERRVHRTGWLGRLTAFVASFRARLRRRRRRTTI
jgi:hypothetical protein